MSTTLFVTFCIAVVALAIVDDDVCRSPDGTLLSSATDCYNPYGDIVCEELYPHNDRVRPMEVGNKNARPIGCYTYPNLTDEMGAMIGRMHAVSRCTQRCGYCCIDNKNAPINQAFDCESIGSNACWNPLIGNMLKRTCPDKCADYIAEDKINMKKQMVFNL